VCVSFLRPCCVSMVVCVPVCFFFPRVASAHEAREWAAEMNGQIDESYAAAEAEKAKAKADAVRAKAKAIAEKTAGERHMMGKQQHLTVIHQ